MSRILEELFGEDARAFVDDYWTRIERHFVAFHGAGRVRDLARLRVFDGIESAVAAHGDRSIVAQRRQGPGPVESHRIQPAQIADFMAERYTIVFERFHDSVPELDKICAELAQTVGFDPELTCCNLFITAPGGGIFKHFDDKDVWVIGLRGLKQFIVAPNNELVYPTANSTEPSADWREYHPVAFTDDMPADASVVDVVPGTTLFIPPGYWHATASRDGAWSLSIALRRPSWRELVTDYISRELIRDPTWRALVPAMVGNAQTIADLEAATKARFLDLARRLGQWSPLEIMSPRSADPLRNRQFFVNTKATVSSEASSNTISVEDSENLTTLDCDDSVRGLVEMIQGAAVPIPFAQLRALTTWSETDLLLVLRGLLHAGVLETQ